MIFDICYQYNSIKLNKMKYNVQKLKDDKKFKRKIIIYGETQYYLKHVLEYQFNIHSN